MTLAALLKDLDGLTVETDPITRRRKSRDYFWFSPLLKQRLDRVMADVVVTPASETEVVQVLAACHRHQVPVTPRGAGTGNYGQAMPLSGGVVLDLKRLTGVQALAGDRVAAGSGAVIGDLDRQLKASQQRALRFVPSTAQLATIGGFVAGGSGGVGSVRWGGLRARGNVLRVRLVTCEAQPRVIDLMGDDVLKAVHAYGTTGVVTEIELPTVESHDWVEVLVASDHWDDAARLAQDLAESDGVLLNELAALAAPLPHDILGPYSASFRREQSALLLLVAPFAMDAVVTMVRQARCTIVFRSDRNSVASDDQLPSVTELGWNHTTLRALRVDRQITYLQTRYPDLQAAQRVRARLGDELPMHIEWMRSSGTPSLGGLPLVRFTTEERLNEIMRIHEEEGCGVFNPHVYTLEEGGWRRPDPALLAFKRQADPLGLLNPGKMVAWDRPDFDFGAGKDYVFPGLRESDSAVLAED